MSATIETGENGNVPTTESRIMEFIDVFGVRKKFTAVYEVEIKSTDTFTGDIDSIDTELNFIHNPAMTVGLYFNEDETEKYHGYSFIEDVQEIPDGAYPHGHQGSSVVTFKKNGYNNGIVDRDWLDKAMTMFGVDLNDMENFRVHGEQYYPVKIIDPHTDSFILIAPRLKE